MSIRVISELHCSEHLLTNLPANPVLSVVIINQRQTTPSFF